MNLKFRNFISKASSLIGKNSLGARGLSRRNQYNLGFTYSWNIEKSGRGITQDEYDKKAYELKNRQYELNDKLKRFIEADENYSITLINLLNICSRAYELFASSKVEQKRQLINFLLSNLKLRDKPLEFELRKPFDVPVNL